MKTLCAACADAAERWMTLYPVTFGYCPQCARRQPLYGTTTLPPDAANGSAGWPWRCPVCAGTGQIETALRRLLPGGWYGRRAPCLACGGAGLVWAGQDAGMRREG